MRIRHWLDKCQVEVSHLAQAYQDLLQYTQLCRMLQFYAAGPDGASQQLATREALILIENILKVLCPGASALQRSTPPSLSCPTPCPCPAAHLVNTTVFVPAHCVVVWVNVL